MRAVIYARVSSDKSGRAKSVAEQVEECRDVCEANGWNIFEIVTDNSIGASRHSGGRRRPGYERLQQVLKAGDVLVQWESSRGTRNLAEYVDMRDLCAERNVLWCFKNRIYDPSHGDDRFMTGLDALRDEAEAERIRDRVLRASRARARTGAPHGKMPYGYTRRVVDDRGTTEWVPDPVTAPIVREIIHGILGGQTIYAIARDLNERGIPGPGEGVNSTWLTRRIRTLVLTPTYAGKRVHKGEIVGDATWEPLITEDEHRRLVALLNDPRRLTNPRRGNAPHHLLSGIAVCGVCGDALVWRGPRSTARGEKLPKYVCKLGYHVGRRADKVDEKVNNWMVSLFSDPRMREELAPAEGDDQDQHYGEALARVQELRQRLEVFYADAADGKISTSGLSAIEARMIPQIEAAEAEVTAARGVAVSGPLAQLVSDCASEPDTKAWWESQTLEVRRAAIRAAVDVVVLPQPPMGRRWDDRFVQVSWRQG